MKAFITLLMVAAIATTGCKKDKNKAEDCTTALNKFTKADEAYGADPSKENCKAYKTAIQDYLNSACASGMTQEQKDSFKKEVDQLECE